MKKSIERVDPSDVVRAVKAAAKKDDKNADASVVQETADEEQWKQRLYRLLIETLTPSAFERLIQRL